MTSTKGWNAGNAAPGDFSEDIAAFNPKNPSGVAEPADELVAYEKALASYLDADVMSADADVATEAFMNGWNSGRAALASSQAASHSAPGSTRYPPLPEPVGDDGYGTDHFDADDMRAYADAHLASHGAPAEPVTLPDFRDRKALVTYIKPAPFFSGLKAMFREYGSADRDEPQEDIARDFHKACDDMCATWEETRSLLAAAPVGAETVASEPVALPGALVIAALRAMDAEARKRGAMFPQTADEQAEDIAAVRRVIASLEFYTSERQSRNGWPGVKGWPSLPAPAAAVTEGASPTKLRLFEVWRDTLLEAKQEHGARWSHPPAPASDWFGLTAAEQWAFEQMARLAAHPAAGAAAEHQSNAPVEWVPMAEQFDEGAAGAVQGLTEALQAVAAQGDGIANLLANGKHNSGTEADHQRWKRMQKTWGALMGQVAAALAARPEGGGK